MILILEKKVLHLSHQVAVLLSKTSITPRQITLTRFIVAAPVSMYFFSRGTYLGNVSGLFFYCLLAVLDWIDGDLAKVKKLPPQTKPLGVAIDSTLDRALMLIVLSGIFYAGMHSSDSDVWTVVVIAYYSFLFFLTSLLYEVQLLKPLSYSDFCKINNKYFCCNKDPCLIDRLLWPILFVGKTSLGKFAFMVSYPLFLGIVVNQLLAAFIFITLMTILRSFAIAFLLFKTLGLSKTNSILINILRKNEKA